MYQLFLVITMGMGIPAGLGAGLDVERRRYGYGYGYCNPPKTCTCDQRVHMMKGHVCLEWKLGTATFTLCLVHPPPPSITHPHPTTPKRDASVSPVQSLTDSLVTGTTHPLHHSATTTLADASHSHDQQSNDCLAPCTRVTKEEEEEEGDREDRQ